MKMIKMSQQNADLIVNELAKKKMSEYETLGEVASALKPLFSLIGIEQADFSKEDELTQENETLKKDIEKLNQQLIKNKK